MRGGYEDTGSGAIIPDGSAVELRSRVLAGDKPDVIAAAVPAGRILDGENIHARKYEIGVRDGGSDARSLSP